ncbi:putative nucleotide-sugar transporter [Helianthus anomalus]
MMKQWMIECSVYHSKWVNPSAKTVPRAYDRHQSKFSKKQQALNVLLVVGDCMLVGWLTGSDGGRNWWWLVGAKVGEREDLEREGGWAEVRERGFVLSK